MSAAGSGVTGGLFGLIVLVALTEPLAKVALVFTPMAYFALGILAISVIATLAEGMLIKGLITGVLGLMIAMVGTDPQSGVNRFTFGRPELLGSRGGAIFDFVGELGNIWIRTLSARATW